MAIRKQICWSNETQSFSGFSSITNSSKHSEDEGEDIPKLQVAKDALVFMVVGPDFKLAVGYHLLNGLESIDRAALTLEAIRSMEGTGTYVMSLTSDGLRANIVVAQLLGSRFDEQITYFQSPTYSEKKFFIIFDPPHMLKLVRKQFSKVALSYQNRSLNWDLLRVLVDKQSSENFNLRNKLTDHNIKWHQKPMNVRMAAETISNSVADALEQLGQDGYAEFKDYEATVEFLRIFNNTFDILNTAQKSESDNGYKQRICNDTAEHIFSFLDKLKQYILGLEIEVRTKKRVHKKQVLDSVAMGFIGFYVDAISLKGIYDEFVRNGPLEEFYTKQFSQDHLETFFSLIRNSQGSNDNPNTVEFRSAFRKLFICHPLLTSAGHNTISDATGISTASSTARKLSRPANLDQSAEFDLEIDYDEIIFNELESMEAFDQHLNANIALNIENEITKAMSHKSKKNCSECANVFAQNRKINDELLAKKKTGSVQQPCESTLQIVILSNAVQRFISSNVQSKDISAVFKAIENNLFIDDLYVASNFVHQQQNEADGAWSSAHKKYFVGVLEIEIRKNWPANNG